MVKKAKPAFGVLTLLLFFTSPLYSQIYTETVTIDATGRSHPGRAYYMPKMFKFVEADGKIVNIRFDREHMISLDQGRNEYWHMSFSDLERRMAEVGGQMEDAMAEMKKRWWPYHRNNGARLKQ